MRRADVSARRFRFPPAVLREHRPSDLDLFHTVKSLLPVPLLTGPSLEMIMPFEGMHARRGMAMGTIATDN
jgi:hypothetical protein